MNIHNLAISEDQLKYSRFHKLVIDYLNKQQVTCKAPSHIYEVSVDGTVGTFKDVYDLVKKSDHSFTVCSIHLTEPCQIVWGTGYLRFEPKMDLLQIRTRILAISRWDGLKSHHQNKRKPDLGSSFNSFKELTLVEGLKDGTVTFESNRL